jgi:2-oxoglutarate ferredoxin oxidoreductase subunit alpha
MHGKVHIPDAKDIDVTPRKNTTREPGQYLPYKIYDGDVPEMVRAGTGHKIHVTGLTHDERGYPAMTVKAQDTLVKRLCRKVNDHVDEISIVDRQFMDDAEVAIISYGISSRVALHAAGIAREKGAKVGTVRLVTVWPFNDKTVEELVKSVKHIIVTEMNLGQIVHEVERVVAKRIPVHFIGNAGGETIDPETIVEKIMEVSE